MQSDLRRHFRGWRWRSLWCDVRWGERPDLETDVGDRRSGPKGIALFYEFFFEKRELVAPDGMIDPQVEDTARDPFGHGVGGNLRADDGRPMPSEAARRHRRLEGDARSQC